MELDILNLSPIELSNLPLFFRQIYSNEISNSEDEKKFMGESKTLQTLLFRDAYPVRQISKTVDYKTLNNELKK